MELFVQYGSEYLKVVVESVIYELAIFHLTNFCTMPDIVVPNLISSFRKGAVSHIKYAIKNMFSNFK